MAVPAVYCQLLHTKNFLVKAYFSRIPFTVTDWEAEEYLAFGQILDLFLIIFEVCFAVNQVCTFNLGPH